LIVKEFPDQREIAAEALLHIGLCYEKLGRSEATKAYQTVLKEYPDQQIIVAKAQEKLAALSLSRTDTKISNQVIAQKIHSEPGFYGTLSPDGKYLSYVDWGKGNMAIHNLETGKKRQITNEGTWKPPSKFGDESLWSPDGKSLAYFWIEGKNSQLRVQNLETGKDRILAENTEDEGCPWPMEWTKDGKYILAKASDRSENIMTLQLVSVKDGSAKIIINLGDQCPCGGASISPDGKYVVASLGKDLEPRDIHIFAVDGSYEDKLISFPGADWAPRWTPDGQKIIFASTRSGHPALWTVKVKDGKKVDEPELIYEGITENYYSLGFTNDGKFVFLSSNTYSNIFHETINPDESIFENPTSLTDNKPGIFTTPFWSPDGSKIAYISRRIDDNYQYGDDIIIHDLKTGNEKNLNLELNILERPGGWESPQWSADGKSILLHYGGNEKLVIVNIETGDKKLLKGNTWKVFGPENTIFYVDPLGNKILQQTISTGKEKTVYKTKKQIYHLSISEDKTTLAFFEGEVGDGVQQELYSMQLKSAEPKLLWEATEKESFSWYGGLNFFPDGKTLLLSLTTEDISKPWGVSKQFYTFDINTMGKKPFGKELSDSNNYIRDVRLSPDGKNLIFSKRIRSTNLWTLEFDF
ncbi:MAG: PD40 domain-containing protein, partial [Mariniphaga sp.]|nr:PD40 domain-containing protein [Mariniphaga sp.]